MNLQFFVAPFRPSPSGMSCKSFAEWGYGLGCLKQRETVKATERDEVKSLGLLEPFQIVWHGFIVKGEVIPKPRSSR
jgi:hypothetical protein